MSGTLANLPSDIEAFLGSDAIPSGSIDGWINGATLEPDGPISFTVPGPGQNGGEVLTWWVINGTPNTRIVTGDLYDLVIDGVVVATSPIVPLNGAGNFLEAFLILTVGVHTCNVVSHLIPYAGMADPYGGGVVPTAYTGKKVVELFISAQLQNYIGKVENFTVSAVTADSFTASWSPLAPVNGGIVSSYNVNYSVHGANSWTAVNVASGTSATITGLLAGTTYDVEVSVVGVGMQATSQTITITTEDSSSIIVSIPNLVFESPTLHGFTLAWQPVNPPKGTTISSYNVVYNVYGKTATTTVNVPSGTSITFNNLPSVTLYQAHVEIVGVGVSGKSDTLTVATT